MHKDAVHAGQAAYTPFTLALYDKAVLGLSCRWLWRCPASRLLDHYQANISDNHLDVGEGSGYFLDQVDFPSDDPRLALMDLNADSQTYCARCVARYLPARGFMSVYNCKDIFSNFQDTVSALRAALASRLDDVQMQVEGCAALFSGRLGYKA